MSANDRLTIEQVDKYAKILPEENARILAKQLVDTMRELSITSEHLAHNEELCLQLQKENESLKTEIDFFSKKWEDESIIKENLMRENKRLRKTLSCHGTFIIDEKTSSLMKARVQSNKDSAK